MPTPLFPRSANVPRAAAMVLDALEAAGLASGTLEQTCAALGAAGRPSSPAAARAMLSAAAAEGALTFIENTFRSTRPAAQGSVATHDATAPAADPQPGQLLAEETTSHPLRLIAFDLESAARARVEDGGAVSRDVWEIGACRFGPDLGWVKQNSTMRVYVTMREGFTVFGSRAGEHAEQHVPPEQAWAQLRAFAADADMIVSYNGTGLDFPLLTTALKQYQLEPLEAEFVDALYLAHRVAGTPPVGQLLERCPRGSGVDGGVDGLQIALDVVPVLAGWTQLSSEGICPLREVSRDC